MIGRQRYNYWIDKKKWRALLRRAGISQKELAEQIGLSANGMSLKILNKRVFTLYEFLMIAETLHISPLDLLTIVETTEPDDITSSPVD